MFRKHIYPEAFSSGHISLQLVSLAVSLSLWAFPGLQAEVAALQRSLEEERERYKTERSRRKELHNALVVRNKHQSARQRW